MKDLTGKVSGKLTVVSFSHLHIQPRGGAVPKWNCLCSCGKTVVVMASNINTGHTTSCGCIRREARLEHAERLKSGEYIPSTICGERFGSLVVKEFSHWKISKDGVRNSYWKCICDCGKTCTKARSGFNKKSDCGCGKKKLLAELRTTHGMASSPTYKTWCKMKERCTLDSYAEKEYYQDKDIKICDRWFNSFENFLEDMGERLEGMTLDRIKHDGDYEPSNCRWADLTIQAFNQRKRSDNTSGRAGVHLRKNGLYNAVITYYKKVIFLARNVPYDVAVRLREEAEMKYYGVVKDE